jgi:hypothetical protein
MSFFRFVNPIGMKYLCIDHGRTFVSSLGFRGGLVKGIVFSTNILPLPGKGIHVRDFNLLTFSTPIEYQSTENPKKSFVMFIVFYKSSGFYLIILTLL